MRVFLFSLLLSVSLQAQVGRPWPPPFTPSLGTDSMAQIQLVYPGCWDGLLLHSVTQGQPPPFRRDPAGATVEVWDLTPQETPRQEAFRLFLGDLRQRLAQALAAPPASHGQTDLAILAACIASQGDASGVDMAMVQSLQDRFNSLPPPMLRPR